MSDLAWLAEAGIPAVLYGPGDFAQAHSSAEYVGVDELVEVAAVVALAALRLVRRGVRTSAFCFAGDLADEGVEVVLDNVQGRAGLGGVTMAAAYHASRDLFPHARARHLRYQPGGEIFFRPDPARLARARAAAAPERPGARQATRSASSSRRPARAASTCRPGRSSCTSTGPRTAIRASPSRRASAIPA